jgi:cation:H+ antiporter
MCIGLFALFNPIEIPDFFQNGLVIILGAGVVHFLFLAILGRTPRFMGLGLIGAYVFFLVKGVIH